MDVVFFIEIGGGSQVQRTTAHVGSFGEREHALSLARLIQQGGYQPRFVVGPLIAGHIRLAGYEPSVFATPAAGVQLVRDIDPAIVIACELFNVSPESARGLIDLGKPLATIDGTSLPVEINTNPFFMPEFSRTLVLPDSYFSFRPCPVNDIAPDTARVSHWSLFSSISRCGKDAQRYETLELDRSRKTVMLAVAPWAVGSATIVGLQDYYQKFVSKVVDGLAAAGEPTDLVFISMFRPPSLTVEGKGAVKVQYRNLIAYDTYDHLLSSCDAIVTDNIIQTSVSKAVVMGTPHLVIQNLQGADMPYAYNMFPLKLLFPADRQYAGIVDTAEFGDPSEMNEKLVRLLQHGYCDGETRARRLAYIDRLKGLANPANSLADIIGRPDEAATRAH